LGINHADQEIERGIERWSYSETPCYSGSTDKEAFSWDPIQNHRKEENHGGWKNLSKNEARRA
jgi:hypothetical protein